MLENIYMLQTILDKLPFGISYHFIIDFPIVEPKDRFLEAFIFFERVIIVMIGFIFGERVSTVDLYHLANSYAQTDRILDQLSRPSSSIVVVLFFCVRLQTVQAARVVVNFLSLRSVASLNIHILFFANVSSNTRQSRTD